MGESWHKFLLENLLGGESGPMADTILARMNERCINWDGFSR